MNFNLLLKLNTVACEPFSHTHFDTAWLAAHRYHTKCLLALHGRRLLIQTIPGVVAISIAKLELQMCAAFELFNWLATKTAWECFGCANYASILRGKIGMLTRSRAICTNAAWRGHELSAATLTCSLSSLCVLLADFGAPFTLTIFGTNTRLAPRLIANKCLMAYVTCSCTKF